MSPARLFAPLAVVASAAAVYLVVHSGTASSGSTATSATTSTSTTSKRTTASAERKRSSYTVKSGDTLGTIAEKQDLSVDDLVDLNPGLDPNSLHAGQKIKLRRSS